jgi:serum/glucocorticoid-regulated kinase 2
LTSSLPYAVIDFDKSQIISKPQSGSSDAPVWRCEYHRHNEFRHCFDVTRQTDLQIWLYQTAPAGADAGSSSFLGTATHRPSFKDEENSSAEWLDLHGGTGAVLITAQFIPNRGFSLGMENFELLRVLDDSRGRHKLVKYT